jgi:hypothetical protein
MGSDALRVGRAAVVTEEDSAIEGFIDSFHHHQGAWPRAHHQDVLRQLLQQQILTIAVRVAHQDFRRSRLAGRLDGDIHLGGHELPKALVLEPRGPELLTRHRTHDPLHVGGDVDPETVLGPHDSDQLADQGKQNSDA